MRGEAALRALNRTGAGKISHVVFIVQENRSFDNMFQGYPGADTVSKRKELEGRDRSTTPREPRLRVCQSITRHRQCSKRAMDRQTPRHRLPDGRVRHRESVGWPTQQNPQYVYVPQVRKRNHTLTWPTSGCSADKTFPIAARREFVAHQYIIAAQADGRGPCRWHVGLRCVEGRYDSDDHEGS